MKFKIKDEFSEKWCVFGGLIFCIQEGYFVEFLNCVVGDENIYGVRYIFLYYYELCSICCYLEF